MEKHRYLTWIHLSDLHANRKDMSRIPNLGNMPPIWSCLFDSINEFMQKHECEPDFIAFTGDIAQSGAADEYELAKTFFNFLLEKTKVNRGRLFIVPGNHDVMRNEVGDAAINPLANLKEKEHISACFNRLDISSRFPKYRQFLEEWLPYYKKLDQKNFAYSVKFKKGSVLVSIVGLNSAGLSGFNKEGRDFNDRGRLAIGEEPALKVLREAQSDITIALVHHPFGWLMDIDEQAVFPQIVRNCDILLTGHQHHPGAMTITSLYGKLCILPAGALNQKTKYRNTYYIARLDLSTGEIEVSLLFYNDTHPEGPRWQPDDIATGHKKGGTVRMSLPKTEEEEKEAEKETLIKNEKFRLYISGVGDPYFPKKEPKVNSLNQPEHRYFGLSGLILREQDIVLPRETFEKISVVSKKPNRKNRTEMYRQVCELFHGKQVWFLHVSVDKRELYSVSKLVDQNLEYSYFRRELPCFRLLFYMLKEYGNFLVKNESHGCVYMLDAFTEENTKESLLRKAHNICEGGSCGIGECIKDRILSPLNFLPQNDCYINVANIVGKLLLEDIEDRGLRKATSPDAFQAPKKTDLLDENGYFITVVTLSIPKTKNSS